VAFIIDSKTQKSHAHDPSDDEGPEVIVASVPVVSPQAVIFDVGGVLVGSPVLAALRWAKDWDLPQAALEKLFGEYSRSVQPGEQPPMWHEVECGRVALAEFVEHMGLILGPELPKGHKARGLTASDFDPFAEAEPIPIMIELAEEIRGSGIRTAILTNNVKEWRKWRDRIPIEHFDPVIDSCEVGVRKPDPAVYSLICNRMGVAPSSCLFLDDYPGNVEAALTAGLDALQVTEDFAAAASKVRERL
jgi:putative hydrolase of the HAD superfamily